MQELQERQSYEEVAMPGKVRDAEARRREREIVSTENVPMVERW
jgi:hypothetical protein